MCICLQTGHFYDWNKQHFCMDT
uniref:Uncharacterized protein n=1 Tax=Arundo donax TaxID=35708 RepID=A0A0A8YQH9_ARUDO